MSDVDAGHSDAPPPPPDCLQVGFLLLLVMAAISPLAFLPADTPWFHPSSPQILFAKVLLFRIVAGTALLCGALCLLREGFEPWRQRPLATTLLLSLGIAQALSCLLSGVGWFSWRQATLNQAGLAVALLSPLFLNTPARRRALLLAAIAAGVIVATISLSAAAGFAGFNKLIYGADPLELIRQGAENLKGFQGGRRGATMATLGNPEYAGNFLAVTFLALGCWLLDAFDGKLRNSLPAWILALAAMAIVAAGMAVTGTRAAWLVVAIGMLCRWHAASSTPAIWIAAIAAITIAAIALLGARPGILVGAIALLATALLQFRTGETLALWRAIPARNRIALLAAPAALALLLVAFSLPGPWNPRGLRVAQSFAGLTTTSDNSVRERFFFWMLAGDMLSHSPVLGVGPGMYGPEFHRGVQRLLDRDDSGIVAITNRRLGSFIGEFAHSDHFQMLAETGILGYGLFIAAMTTLLATLRRHFRSTGDALAGATLVCLCGYLAMMLTSFPLHDPGRLPVFWSLIALAFSFREVR